MRIWDLPTYYLCRQHLLGEHRELHAIWDIYTKGNQGYRNHPEVLRWKNSLHHLYVRHEKLVVEMVKRGYNHNSPLDISHIVNLDPGPKPYLLISIKAQKSLLKEKGCSCGQKQR